MNLFGYKSKEEVRKALDNRRHKRLSRIGIKRQAKIGARKEAKK